MAGASSQPRLGRITSPQTSSMIARPASSETCSGSRGPRPLPASHSASRPRHGGLPAASAPLVIHRSCQVSPGWASSQSSTWITPRRRSWSRLARPAGNGGASSLAITWGLGWLVSAQLAGTGRGGCRCNIATDGTGLAGNGRDP